MASQSKRTWTDRDSSHSDDSDENRTDSSRRHRRADSSVTSHQETVPLNPAPLTNFLPSDPSAMGPTPFRDQTNPDALLAETGLHHVVADRDDESLLAGWEETDGRLVEYTEDPFAPIPSPPGRFGDFQCYLDDFWQLVEREQALSAAATPILTPEPDVAYNFNQDHDDSPPLHDLLAAPSLYLLDPAASPFLHTSANVPYDQPETVNPRQLHYFPVTNEEDTSSVGTEDDVAREPSAPIPQETVIGGPRYASQESTTLPSETRQYPDIKMLEVGSANILPLHDSQEQPHAASVPFVAVDAGSVDEEAKEAPLIDESAADCGTETPQPIRNDDGTLSCAHSDCTKPKKHRRRGKKPAKRFHRRGDWKKHYRIHEKSKYRRCTALIPDLDGPPDALRQCDFMARHKAHLVAHIEPVHLGIMAKCTQCDHVEARHDNLVGPGRHFRRRHPGMDIPTREQTRHVTANSPNVAFLGPPGTAGDQRPSSVTAAAAALQQAIAGPSQHQRREAPSSSGTQAGITIPRQAVPASLAVGSASPQQQTLLQQPAYFVDSSIVNPMLHSLSCQQVAMQQQYLHAERQSREESARLQFSPHYLYGERLPQQQQELMEPAREQFLRDDRGIQGDLARRYSEFHRQYQQQHPQQHHQSQVEEYFLPVNMQMREEWARRQFELRHRWEQEQRQRRGAHALRYQVGQNANVQAQLTPDAMQQVPVGYPNIGGQHHGHQNQHVHPELQESIQSHSQGMEGVRRSRGDQHSFQAPSAKRRPSRRRNAGLVRPPPSIPTPPSSPHTSVSGFATPVVTRQVIHSSGYQPNQVPSPPETVARSKRPRHGCGRSETLGSAPHSRAE